MRNLDEYKFGHIKGSINIPVDRISDIKNIISNKDSNIFVHCLSGMRSQRATKASIELGYKNTANIGGIQDWNGEIERG